MEQQTKQANRERVAQIMRAAFKLAERKPYNTITREELAAALGWSGPSLISHHMGTMENFRRTLMREAVRVGNCRVIAQGLVIHDRHARKAPEELRRRAMAEMVNG